jgi:hypothetical protein
MRFAYVLLVELHGYFLYADLGRALLVRILSLVRND